MEGSLIVISFAPFESELLSRIQSHEKLSPLPDDIDEVTLLIHALFENWSPYQRF